MHLIHDTVSMSIANLFNGKKYIFVKELFQRIKMNFPLNLVHRSFDGVF